uniref:Uncharacterized protein n=1 Tax=Arundo donax TaxID=35708 RepID=A0A0A9GI89_ARUDO
MATTGLGPSSCGTGTTSASSGQSPGPDSACSMREQPGRTPDFFLEK